MGVDILQPVGGVDDFRECMPRFDTGNVRLEKGAQPCHPLCCKIGLSVTVTVPGPSSEMDLPGKLWFPEKGFRESIVEVSEKFHEKDLGLLVACTLVKVSKFQLG